MKETSEHYEEEKRQLDIQLKEKIMEKVNEEDMLLAKIESLKADYDFSLEQLSAMKAKYENIKNGELSGQKIINKDDKGKTDCMNYFFIFIYFQLNEI